MFAPEGLVETKQKGHNPRIWMWPHAYAVICIRSQLKLAAIDPHGGAGALHEGPCHIVNELPMLD